MNLNWHPASWRNHPAAQQPTYPDPEALERALAQIRAYPPLVSAGEVERLREELAEVAEGRRFLLQGGDCAEALEDCRPTRIANQLKVLLQMSLVLTHGLGQPVVRVGRMAGQYAKPRSSAVERVGDREIESYRGDLVNEFEPDERKRIPNPERLVRAYQTSALTLNFIRALIEGGFADLHHPEYWDLSPLAGTGSIDRYQAIVDRIRDAVHFVDRLGVFPSEVLTRVDFYVSHEGLHLAYEEAQTRTVPRRDGYYNLGAHMLWIGDRTRDVEGAHVEYFRGIRNPIGVKLGPSCAPAEAAALVRRLNPEAEPGRLTLITRMGTDRVETALPDLVRAVSDTGTPVVWCVDPMHGNAIKTRDGRKTRDFGQILREVELTSATHEAEGTVLGGLHLELTGEAVTECTGGATGLTEADLGASYETYCDPRLNYAQSLEIAFLAAQTIGTTRADGRRTGRPTGVELPGREKRA